ncbi:DNA polymerase III subunit tau, partial [isoform gamma] [Buchnera aphidicola (Pterocallis alni)]|uniref:DNA polymerase III subunit gamma/tau n=1 Tax=Buchnera aphidicola TaxID=9 RepID=UPI0034639807
MHYKILATKWRPKSFIEVIGQKHIINAISNSFKNNKIHQSWILSGSRGTGKTTVARLLAKSLNCHNISNMYSCNTCLNCKNIEKKCFPDLIEIDAASKTKVEDIKELLETIKYPPMYGKFKIYLIDEIHMLSKNSFNALLKVLEEPPKYIKFILITTEIYKIPKTIISRCIYFNFQKIPSKNIRICLKNIFKAEKIHAEETVLNILAKQSKGSMRDALNLTEKAIMIDPKIIRTSSILQMFGLIHTKQILKVILSIIKKNTIELMSLLHEMYDANIKSDQILIEILKILYKISILKNIPYTKQYKEKSNYKKKIYTLSKQIHYKKLKNYYKIILKGRKEISLAPNKKIGLEMTLLHLIHYTNNPNNTKKR